MEKLLAKLKKEREKFTGSNKKVMKKLIKELIKLGVYPESTPVMRKYNYTHLVMVESWGEDWYMWREPLECPHCHVDLRDHKNGPPFKREIGYVQNDRLSCYTCPDCKAQFNKLAKDKI